MLKSEEIAAAAAWISERARLPLDGPLAVSLQAVLGERYKGHWYPQEPHRGAAFRSLECTDALDKWIARAAEMAAVQHSELRAALGTLRMWINPGEVKVRTPAGTSIIYGGGSSNPYSKPKLNIEKTRLVVSSDGNLTDSESVSSDGGPGSPDASIQQEVSSSMTPFVLAAGRATSDQTPARLSRSSSLSASAPSFDPGMRAGEFHVPAPLALPLRGC